MSISHIKKAPLARLFVGIMYADRQLLEHTLRLLVRKFGPITAQSAEYNFSRISQYYDKEIEGMVHKRIYMFGLIDPGDIPDIKIWTNKTEELFSKDGKRQINLDPGYISITNVVLASTKNYTHRMYLKKGIFAELTLIFKKNDEIQEFDWTYPDFQLEKIKQFLIAERHKLLGGRGANSKKDKDDEYVPGVVYND